jgi:hypothetical protein
MILRECDSKLITADEKEVRLWEFAEKEEMP